jgi:hypothetical protein
LPGIQRLPSLCRYADRQSSRHKLILDESPIVRLEFFWGQNPAGFFRHVHPFFRLSPSCPLRLLHTFFSLRPARHYPRFRCRRFLEGQGSATTQGCTETHVVVPAVLPLATQDSVSPWLPIFEAQYPASAGLEAFTSPAGAAKNETSAGCAAITLLEPEQWRGEPRSEGLRPSCPSRERTRNLKRLPATPRC